MKSMIQEVYVKTRAAAAMYRQVIQHNGQVYREFDPASLVRLESERSKLIRAALKYRQQIRAGRG